MISTPKITGLVISAGFSSRMPGLKPLMAYEGKPFLAGILLKLFHICDSILVVTGFESEKIEKTTKLFLEDFEPNINSKVSWHFNPEFEKGMFSSLQTGVRVIKDSNWILYHFVDQPGIPLEFYTYFKGQIDSNYDWIQPSFQAKNGHPLLFSQKTAAFIFEANPKQSLRELKKTKNIQTKYWPCAYPQILKDFNSVEELDQSKNL